MPLNESSDGAALAPTGLGPPPVREMPAFGSLVHAAMPLPMFDAALGTPGRVPSTKKVMVPDSPPGQRRGNPNDRQYADAGGLASGLGAKDTIGVSFVV